MKDWPHPTQYTADVLRREGAALLAIARESTDLGEARRRLFTRMSDHQFVLSVDRDAALEQRVVVRDCARAFRHILTESADARSGFSVMQALWDVAHDVPRPDLGPGFFAELIHMVRGVEGRAPLAAPGDVALDTTLSGRAAARARSRELDGLWDRVVTAMGRYEDGLTEEARVRRAVRRGRIMNVLGAGDADWGDWRWQARHVLKDPDQLARLVSLSEGELAAVRTARAAGVPFGITPYYLSLMDDDPQAGRDRAVRAQVLPPAGTVRELAAHHGERERAFDFMLEHDTSPIDLVTRRYPSIAILKPYNTCPQICVYCQRNWEIEDAMAANALAPPDKIEAACAWIARHPAIHEVLVTGGDPLALGDRVLGRILGRVARIDSVDLIRVGSRVPVTMPMRVTDELAALLGSLRRPGYREVAVVTHVEHPYEITPDFVEAVDRLRRQGIAVYNQLVYTYYVSRRFEAARLRMLLRRAGVDPYYTFVPKGKEETRAYRVPLARLLQEQKEEARLLPGLRRTDEAVFNVPGLGKSHVRALQHRDVISILPDGSRVYEVHPWEKNVMQRQAYVATDVPILEYLTRLAADGEAPEAYESIWYYF